MGDPCLGEVRDTGLILEQLPLLQRLNTSPLTGQEATMSYVMRVQLRARLVVVSYLLL